MKNTTVNTNILPLRVHAHCTAAPPSSLVACIGAIGIACIVSPAMSAVKWIRDRVRC